MPSPTQPVLSRSGPMATLELQAPTGKPPTLDLGVLQRLGECVEQIEQAPPGVLVLRSSSDRYFCVGAHVDSLQNVDATSIEVWIRAGHDLLNRIEDLPCPVIARVEGFALGGGLELAMACDLIFAGPNARLGLTEATLGFVPGWGGCLRLVERIGRAAARRCFFTGTVLDAAQAAAVGLVDALAGEGRLDDDLARYSEAVLACCPGAIARFKRATDPDRAARRETNLAVELEQSAACIRDQRTAQRLASFLAKRRHA